MGVGISAPGTYECHQCRKIYKWYRGLHRHLEYECGKMPRFKCPHCTYIGKHRSHVYSHIKNPFLKWSMQGPRNIDYIENLLPRHQCPNCNRSYKHRSHMMRHYKYECGGTQRFECPYCKHHLRQRTHVWTHIRTFHPDCELYCIDIVTNTRLSWQEIRSD
ncbi:longitudinals lacking protein, isoforms N/O/W/X/Y-like [Monomorium pharaonis]|uniref:longitudinals lacking protein, isoforms N/O/W/X/Y-like n=1 Tax=Monomorium pharaonis TaxID=307658 RepID=UPI00174745DF|nr:longitudinals lacking protein, isoforms N/O/W/X/Y-like [Monomorium pharaonis]